MLRHHELCFGCGRTNLFGLMLELEATAEDAVAGRCFIKQDHQGPDRGLAHDGVVAAALTEAMALACGVWARAQRIEVHVAGSARVGTFLEISASVEQRSDDVLHAHASARTEDEHVLVAHASGTYANSPG